jgi:hypothetical protein
MTDKKLLELAAKATGDFYTHPDNKIPDGLPVIFYLDGKQWDPLTDDGDALRLAVKLNILDKHEIAIAPVNCWADEDPYAATRRAIVIAAAKIGKTL